MKEQTKEITYKYLMKELDAMIDVLKRPKTVPPASIPRLLEEIERMLQNFDRSKLDANKQRKLLKKTGWYKTQLTIARHRKKI